MRVQGAQGSHHKKPDTKEEPAESQSPTAEQVAAASAAATGDLGPAAGAVFGAEAAGMLTGDLGGVDASSFAAGM